jgi:hypothetical protein
LILFSRAVLLHHKELHRNSKLQTINKHLRILMVLPEEDCPFHTTHTSVEAMHSMVRRSLQLEVGTQEETVAFACLVLEELAVQHAVGTEEVVVAFAYLVRGEPAVQHAAGTEELVVTFDYLELPGSAVQHAGGMEGEAAVFVQLLLEESAAHLEASM